MPSNLEKRLRALAAIRARQNEEWARARQALTSLSVEAVTVPQAFLDELDELARPARRPVRSLSNWPARPGLRG